MKCFVKQLPNSFHEAFKDLTPIHFHPPMHPIFGWVLRLNFDKDFVKQFPIFPQRTHYVCVMRHYIFYFLCYCSYPLVLSLSMKLWEAWSNNSFTLPKYLFMSISMKHYIVFYLPEWCLFYKHVVSI